MGNTLSSTMKEGTTLLASFIDHHPYIENICYCFELLLRLFLKCLGLEYWGVSSSTSDEHSISLDDHEVEDDEPLNKDIEKKTSEDFVVTRNRGLVKKPPKKPPSSGGGGQINSASS